MEKAGQIMNAAEIIALIEKGEDIFKKISRTYGFIHRRTPAVINGKKGFLIWDFIIWNEITFKADDGEIASFFSSISDRETEEVWNELVRKYGA